MFSPNQRGLLYRQGAYDLYGQPAFESPVEIGFSPIDMTVSNVRTSVRADSSASRGSSDETISQAKILVDKHCAIKIGDRFQYDGSSFRIAGVHNRRTVYGRLDHIECDLELMP